MIYFIRIVHISLSNMINICVRIESYCQNYLPVQCSDGLLSIPEALDQNIILGITCQVASVTKTMI